MNRGGRAVSAAAGLRSVSKSDYRSAWPFVWRGWFVAVTQVMISSVGGENCKPGSPITTCWP